MTPSTQGAVFPHPLAPRPTTLNAGPRDPRLLAPRQEQELERRLHRQVLQTIRETFGQD